MRLILLPLLLASPLVLANECQFSAERNLDIDPAGLQALRMELGSSDLNVQGDPAATRIEVHGKACASEQAWLDELQIDLIPVLFGSGRRLFELLPARVELEIVNVIDTPDATHIRYSVRR